MIRVGNWFMGVARRRTAVCRVGRGALTMRELQQRWGLAVRTGQVRLGPRLRANTNVTIRSAASFPPFPETEDHTQGKPQYALSRRRFLQPGRVVSRSRQRAGFRSTVEIRARRGWGRAFSFLCGPGDYFRARDPKLSGRKGCRLRRDIDGGGVDDGSHRTTGRQTGRRSGGKCRVCQLERTCCCRGRRRRCRWSWAKIKQTHREQAYMQWWAATWATYVLCMYGRYVCSPARVERAGVG